MKSARIAVAGALVGALGLSGCVAPPPGPTIPVMPGAGKPFAAFNADDIACRQFAESRVAPGVYAANQQGFGTALVGTALGAGLGAAIGGGRGAAIGAASGAAAGTVVGAGGANYAQLTLQQQYDMAYGQCMYAKGNRVPGFGPPPGGPPGPPPPGAPVPPPYR